jgi:hypothetical protein
MVVIEAPLFRLCAISAIHTRPRLLTVSRWRRQRGEDGTSEARPFRPPARRQGVAGRDRAFHSRRRQVRPAYPRESPSVSNSVHSINHVDPGSTIRLRGGETVVARRIPAMRMKCRLRCRRLLLARHPVTTNEWCSGIYTFRRYAQRL